MRTKQKKEAGNWCSHLSYYSKGPPWISAVSVWDKLQDKLGNLFILQLTKEAYYAFCHNRWCRCTNVVCFQGNFIAMCPLKHGMAFVHRSHKAKTTFFLPQERILANCAHAYALIGGWRARLLPCVCMGGNVQWETNIFQFMSELFALLGNLSHENKCYPYRSVFDDIVIGMIALQRVLRTLCVMWINEY